jgi:Tfp pilus assembly protein PilX
MRIKRKARNWKDERGVSLFIALLTLLIISLLTTGIIFVTQTETFTTANYTELTQARYAAEAGVQSTINWLSNNYTAPTNLTPYDTSAVPVTCVSGCANSGAPVVISGVSGVPSNYADSAVVSAYNSALSNQVLNGLMIASYSTYAKLVSMNSGSGVSWLTGGGGAQTWQITSQGTVTGIRTATVQVTATYERTGGTPIFPYAVFATGNACPTINFSSSGYTDSYDSSQGTYAATMQATGGNIGTNGSLTMSGSSTIKGNAYLVSVVTTGSCPTKTFTNSSSNGVTGNGGSPTATGSPKSFSNPVYTNPSPALTTSTNYSNNVSLSPGNYNNVSVSGGKTLTLSPGTYNFNSLKLSGGSIITVSPAGTVVLEIAGAGSPSKALDFSGGSIANTSGTPASFQIVYSGSQDMTLSGSSSTAAVVYAPNSDIDMSGSSPWFGSIVGKSFNNSGGSAVHYDRSLGTSLVSGGGSFQLIGFSWSKF